jgi:hypothetical protein
VPGGQFSPKLIGCIDGGVHFASELRLGLCQGRHHVAKRQFAHHKHIDVAIGFLPGRGHRTVDQRELDSVGERGQRGPQDIRHAGRFHDQRLEFLEHGAFGIGLEVDLLVSSAPPNDSRFRKGLQFSLNSAVAPARQSHYLTEIKRLIRMAKQQAQNGAAVAREQGLGQQVYLEYRTHI